MSQLSVCNQRLFLLSQQKSNGFMFIRLQCTSMPYWAALYFAGLPSVSQCSNYGGLGGLAPLVQALPQTSIIGLRSALAIRLPENFQIIRLLLFPNRRNKLYRDFFQKMRNPSCCFHHFTTPCDPERTSRFRNASTYPTLCNRTNYYQSFTYHAL